MANITTLNRGWRKLGARNRISGELKEMVEEALHQAGGVNYLARQAEENPSPFLSLVGKLLPKNVNAAVQTGPTLEDFLDACANDESPPNPDFEAENRARRFRKRWLVLYIHTLLP